MFFKEKITKKANIKIYKNKKNLFTAGTRNAGLKKTTGQYILFIDDDNEIDKEDDEIEYEKSLELIGPSGLKKR